VPAAVDGSMADVLRASIKLAPAEQATCLMLGLVKGVDGRHSPPQGLVLALTLGGQGLQGTITCMVCEKVHDTHFVQPQASGQQPGDGHDVPQLGIGYRT